MAMIYCPKCQRNRLVLGKISREGNFLVVRMRCRECGYLVEEKPPVSWEELERQCGKIHMAVKGE